MRYSMRFPDGGVTVRIACPICLTIMEPPARTHTFSRQRRRMLYTLTTEACLLGIVSDQLDALALVLNDIGGYRWMV